MKSYMGNIFKAFLILFFILVIETGNTYSLNLLAQAGINTNSSNQETTGGINRNPFIIELEDPIEVERSQLFFPDDVIRQLKLKKEEYKETPFRRGEIIFLIAYPYAYMYNLMFLELIMKSSKGNRAGLNKYHYIYILIISAITAGFIAYDDNRFVYSSPIERERFRREREIRFDFDLYRYRF